VLDTNVVMSAVLLPQSLARQAFDQARKRGILLLSTATAQELDAVIQRPKFDRYVPLEHRLRFLTTFILAATLITTTETVTDCRDANDNKFLELAVSGRATCIVSGDNDLLALHPFRGIPILTPRQLLDQVAGW
jgi:putative PIN family toxin of toxin-antitoxin system